MFSGLYSSFLPIGFSFGKNSLTKAWFTITTLGVFSRSVGRKSRPRTSGMRIVSKSPGVAMSVLALGERPGGAGGRPTTLKL
jgi:hypothetical protein